ncbi:MAG: glycoside hydrolase family 38 C-terminal domain-containing protein [Limnochordia bacterium]
MYFTIEKAQKYLSDLANYIYVEQICLESLKHWPEDLAGAHLPEFDDSNWPEFKVGSSWGGRDQTYWFRRKVTIPPEWKGKKAALYLVVGSGESGGIRGAESLAYIDGAPVQGLDVNHWEILLKPEWMEAGEIQLAIKSWSGLQDELRWFTKAALVRINEEAEDFYFRAATMLAAIRMLAENDLTRINLINILNKAINATDFRRPGSAEFYASIAKANEQLRADLAACKAESGRTPTVIAVGHSHIDVAWLWRLKHTREKSSRTFSTVNYLMDQYPEYQFLQSQPQLYEYIKHDYPEIYARIKENIRAGRWEVTGGMWLEADCNVTSGESLVRQFLMGQKFMEEEFGIRSRVLWLPDVFGYSWALPQIIKKSGHEYFMTTKISWNQYNRTPYDTFMWRGIDGTEVLTYFITTTPSPDPDYFTYNGVLDPESVVYSWHHYQQKDINDELLFSFGYGDGGGGPTKQMIETGRRMQEIPGLPQVKFGKAEPFFDRLAARVKGNPRLPVVDGELYLEYHRGTYTSQGRTKRNNRLSEIMLHDVEFFNTLAISKVPGHKYPQDQINENWKTVLRNQFHDVLPGSSIAEVYQDSSAEYAQVLDSSKEHLNAALTALAARVDLPGEKLVVFNSLSWARGGKAVLPWTERLAGKAFVDEDGSLLESRVVETTVARVVEVEVPEIPSFGYKSFRVVDGAEIPGSTDAGPEEAVRITGSTIESPYYRIVLNDAGQITSLFDKQAQREVVPEGMAANVIEAFEDKPMEHDAWDIDIYYREKRYSVQQACEWEVLENGPSRVVLAFTWPFLESTIKQRMIVYANNRRIDFETEVDWHERQILLKAAFPVAVRATKATYEIQFGNVERPTHWNTSWDYAKFETVAQKWIDLSQRDYGVSLLNDCKYGHDVKDNVMRITLLKSAIFPDPNADQGHHEFTYSLLPHTGDWYEGGTTRAAYELNYPLRAVYADAAAGSLPSSDSLIKVSGESAVLETVKKSEADSSLILRFYEFGNRTCPVEVELASDLASVQECNLMEEDDTPVPFTGSKFAFELQPYEIKTFKIELK